MKRVLLLATTTGYQTRMFGEAAERRGIELVFATDRCDQLDDPWWDHAIPIRFHREDASVRAIVRALQTAPVGGVLAVGDRATVIAASAAQALGLPSHPPEAAVMARDKRLTRRRLQAAGAPGPWFKTVDVDDEPREIVGDLEWPAVIKPVALSGSRGVMRVDGPEQFLAAFGRLRRLLESPDVRAMRDPAADSILIEGYVEGREYAVEGLFHHGQLVTLAIFDKPDPLDGPFFEETLYVTPARTPDTTERALVQAVGDAARALGLYHGPIHAECRVNPTGVYVLEVAARPIGGLCARALAFEDATGNRIGLEDLLLAHATGQSPHHWGRERQASGVMMVPIEKAGIYRRTDGLEEARRVPGVEDVRITAKPDQELVPLPEGASYLGFIFARADRPEDVESALREAHAKLTFVIDRAVPIAAE